MQELLITWIMDSGVVESFFVHLHLHDFGMNEEHFKLKNKFSIFWGIKKRVFEKCALITQMCQKFENTYTGGGGGGVLT